MKHYRYGYEKAKGDGYYVFLYSVHTGDKKEHVGHFRTWKDAARFCNRKNIEDLEYDTY